VLDAWAAEHSKARYVVFLDPLQIRHTRFGAETMEIPLTL
jgi:hypothetical protein